MTHFSAGRACHLPALMDVVSPLAANGATPLVVASIAPVSTVLTVLVGAVDVFFSASSGFAYGGGILCVDGCRRRAGFHSQFLHVRRRGYFLE